MSLEKFSPEQLRQSNATKSFCSISIAAQRAELLIGCYRKGDAANPEIFATALVALFCDYPESIVRKVSDPRSGIPGKQKFFPSIAEVRHECEIEAAKVAQIVAQAARDLDRAIGLPAPEVDRSAVMAKIRARYPEIYDRGRKEREAERIAAAEMLQSVPKLAYWRSPVALSEAARQTFVWRSPVEPERLSDQSALSGGVI